MKKLLALLIIGVLIAPAFAQDGSISGFVWDANTSLPIIGADILAIGPDSGWAYTDSIGAYQVTGLYPGSYTVIAHASGYESGRIDRVIVNAGQNTPDVNFWLVPSGTPEYGSISGSVYDTTTGMPIPGAHVIAQGPGWGDDYTDSIGGYYITDLEPGTYSVTASANGYDPATNDGIVVYEGQNTPDINFMLFPGGTPEYGSISGFVWDANTSMPIPRAHVIAQGPTWGDAYTDSVGVYQITELEEGWYVVEVSAPGYVPGAQDTVLVFAGQNTPNVNFWLYPSGGSDTGISGLVTNAQNNNPIFSALVIATNPYESGQDNTNFYGEYFIQDLSPGFYLVIASAIGFEPAVYPDSVEVIDGQITTDIDFALVPVDTTQFGGISGYITDAEYGYPIPFAQVYASGPNGQGRAYSDSIGVYLIYDLAEGNYEVRAAARGYYPATYPESVLVNAGQITPDIDFALTPSDTGGVAGFVVDGETGLTIPNAQITATGPSGTIQVETNDMGDYLVDDLEHGVYQLDIEAPGYDPISYPDAILVLSGWIESFISPVLYPPYSVDEQTQDHMNRISLNVCPNPFKTSSQISWQVGKETSVRLRVFDATGRVVRNLLDTSLKPDSYSVTWDGTDDHGSAVARGVYFYKLETDEANITVKTVFLK